MFKRKILVLTLLFISLTSCMEGQKPITIGHRGAMGHETENTVASIQSAIDFDVDMIEIDVFKIKTGEIVVFHDDEVNRLTDGKGAIESYTFSELRKLKVEGGHTIPTLQEVLDVMDAKVDLNIELKGANTAVDVNRVVKKYIQNHEWQLSDFIISSFNWDELRTMRKENSEMPIAVLTGQDPLKAIPVAKELKAKAINPNFKKLTAENNLAIKNAGFKVYPWTVNEPEDILRMKRFGVSGIITNYPERTK